MSEDDHTGNGPDAARGEQAPHDGPANGDGDNGSTLDVADGDDTPGGSEPTDLVQTLLSSDIASDDKPGRRWAYPVWGILLVSVFVLYHAAVLLVHNLPSGGLSKGVHAWFNKHLDASNYMRATGNTQSWAMFAPNPHRSNIFMRVLVKDADGEVYDLKHDCYGKREWPYLWYSRMGKINRRLVDQKGYRRHYAAWVCRDWEMTYGELPEEVQFTKIWTRVPTPEKLLHMTKGQPWRGYDPMKLQLHEVEEDKIRCKTTRHAQLPNYMRERLGMEAKPPGYFRGQTVRTWVDEAENADAAAEREEMREEAREEREEGQ